jgi:hypothetical protein
MCICVQSPPCIRRKHDSSNLFREPWASQSVHERKCGMEKKVLYLKWILLFMLYPFFLPTVVLCDIHRCGKDYCKEKPSQGYCKPCYGGDAIPVTGNCERLPNKKCEDLVSPATGGKPPSPGSSPTKAPPLPSEKKMKNELTPAIDKP